MNSQEVAYVTGATGFVGSHLCERLVREGYSVRALVLEGDDRSFLETLGVECLSGDVTGSPAALKEGVRGVSYVFHCAARVDDWAPRATMLEVNVNGLRNVLEAIRGEDIKRFVFLGSMVVYGDGDMVNVDESHPFVRTGDNYNLTKIECERVLREYVRETGLPAVVLRPTYIYGERDRQFFPRLFEAMLSGRWLYLSGGKVPFTLVNVQNVAEACMLAATREEAVGEGFLIADAEAITRRELGELICEEMGYEHKDSSVPRLLARLACPFYELFAKLFHTRKSPRLNRFVYQFAASHITFDISKARRMLGYEPTNSLQTSLRQTTRWFKRNCPEFLPRN